MRDVRDAKKVVCEHCGSEGFFDGVLIGLTEMSIAIRFVPDGLSSWMQGAKVEAMVCTTCGHVKLWTDPDAVRRLLGASS